jgi:starvation-inducible DNA-binding protein
VAPYFHEALAAMLWAARRCAPSATSRARNVPDNDADYVEPLDMLAELREDSKALAARLRQVHNVCSSHHDIASASLIEIWIDETERRTWFLFEASRQPDSGGH